MTDITRFNVSEQIRNCLLLFEKKWDRKGLDLVLEFDERATPEAKFAFFCDKLECDLQSKLYDEEGLVDLNQQEGNKTIQHSKVKELLNRGISWSEMWLRFGQDAYPYDENFIAVSNYAINNDIGYKKRKSI